MLDLLANRIAMTQLSGLLLSGLAACHIILPPRVDATGIVAAIMVTCAALSAMLRIGQAGAPGAGVKAWWQSRTIWAQIVSAGFAAAALAGATPATGQADILEMVMTLVGVVSAVTGSAAARPIAIGGARIGCAPAAVAGALALAFLLGGCGIATVRNSGDVAAALTEAGFDAEITLMTARINSSAATRDDAAHILLQLDIDYAALLTARAAFDAADPGARNGTPSEGARAATDAAYMALRARLVGWTHAKATLAARG